MTCRFKCCVSVTKATFQAVYKSGRREDNSVIPFINLVKFREMEKHQNSICVIGVLGVTCYRDLKLAGSNPTEVDGLSQNVKILSTNPPEYEISGLLINLKPEKIGLWAKFKWHIHVLVSKFGEHNRSQKGCSALGSNEHPINTIQYNAIQA